MRRQRRFLRLDNLFFVFYISTVMTKHRQGEVLRIGSGIKHRASSTSRPCILRREENKWTAHDPSLGCWGVGGTRQMAVKDLAEAMREMIAYLNEIGETPAPAAQIEIGETEI